MNTAGMVHPDGFSVKNAAASLGCSRKSVRITGNRARFADLKNPFDCAVFKTVSRFDLSMVGYFLLVFAIVASHSLYHLSDRINLS